MLLVSFQIVGKMFAGDSFGELALLHDIKRSATIICKGTVEFLTVDKPDFNMVCFLTTSKLHVRRDLIAA